MIESSGLICALNALLQGKFPGIRLYGNDVSDGMERPYFFVECVPGGITYETINFVKQSCFLKITYRQKAPDEADGLKKVREIRDAIGLKFCVGIRKLNVKSYSYDYVGEYNNILQISIDLEWYDNLYLPPEGAMIESVDMALRKGDT